MIRATTPRHIFLFDTDPTVYTKILITYQQNGRIVFEKTKDDLVFEQMEDSCSGETKFGAWFRLTQEESNKFEAGPGKQVTVQIRVLTTANEALASDKKTFSVQDVLNDEVLV